MTSERYNVIPEAELPALNGSSHVYMPPSNQQHPQPQAPMFYQPTYSAGSPTAHDPHNRASDDLYGDSMQIGMTQQVHGQHQEQPTSITTQQPHHHRHHVPYRQPTAPPAANFFNPSTMMSGQMDPLGNLAMSYGSMAAGRYKDMMMEKLDGAGYMDSLYRLFDVNTTYVLKKLAIVSFPFINLASSDIYGDMLRPPSLDTSSPDLYIPFMCMITFIFTCGLSLELTNRFSPEVLGVLASKILLWLLVEQFAIAAWKYLCSIDTMASWLDLLAFCGYKYWMCLVCSTIGLIAGQRAYWIILGYCSIAIAYFISRSLKLSILSESRPVSHPFGNKRRLYLLSAIMIAQPFFIWLLTIPVI